MRDNRPFPSCPCASAPKRVSAKPFIYSCFEKGCLTNGQKLTRQCRNLLWVMVVFTVARGNLKGFQRGGMKQHKHVFVFSRSLLLNRLEPQSNKVKLLLPIMPIGIVAYAFTLFVRQPLSKQLYMTMGFNSTCKLCKSNCFSHRQFCMSSRFETEG